MAFDVRCPECRAKLRLDEAPDPDTPIECPRCGSQFAAPDEEAPAKPARPAGKRKPKGKGKPPPGAPRKRKALKRKTNPFVLVLSIVGGFTFLIVSGFGLYTLMLRTGSVEEMLTYVPDSCNWARGVNVSQLAKYPGYKSEVDKYMTGPVVSAANELAGAAGHDPEKFVDYLVIAKNRGGGGNPTMYVLRTQRSFKPDELGAALTGATPQGDGAYKMPAGAPGILAGATVHMPTRRLVVVIPPNAQSLVSGSLAGKDPANKDRTFAGKLDATARVVMRGSIWLVIRATGGLSDYVKAMTKQVANDLKALDNAGQSATTFGMWTTPGGSGVRVGAAMQCSSPKEASDLVRAMWEGPLGKADESEPTNELKRAWQLAADKKAWGEFMQYLDFRSKRECAYIVSTVSGDNSKRFMDMFNNPTTGTGETQGFGPQAGFGAPGGP